MATGMSETRRIAEAYCNVANRRVDEDWGTDQMEVVQLKIGMDKLEYTRKAFAAAQQNFRKAGSLRSYIAKQEKELASVLSTLDGVIAELKRQFDEMGLYDEGDGEMINPPH